LAELLRRLFERVLDLRAGVLLGLALVTVAALTRLFPTDRLLVDFSLEALLVPDARSRAELAEFQAAFGDDEAVVAAVVVVPAGRTVFEPSTVAELASLADWLRARPEIDPSAVVALPDLALLQGRIVPDALRGAAPETLPEVGRALLAHRLYRGALVSEDGRATFLVGPLAPLAASPDRRRGVIDAWSARLELARPNLPAGAEVLATGIPLVQETYAELALRDIILLVPLTIVVIAALLTLAFRRAYAVLGPLCAVGLATTWTLGLIQATGTAFNIVNCVSGAVLLVVGVADGAHIVARHREEVAKTSDRREAILRTMIKMAPACFVTSATTAVGFASLATAELPVLRDFGVHLAIGVMLAYAAQMVVMPLLLASVGNPCVHDPDARTSRALVRVEGLVARRHKLVVAVALALGVGATFGLARLDSDARALGELHADHPVAQSVAAVETHLAGVLSHAVEVRSRPTGASCRHKSDCAPSQGCALRDPVHRAIDTLREPLLALTGRRDDPLWGALDARLRPAPSDDLLVVDGEADASATPQDGLVGVCVESVTDPEVVRALADIALWIERHDGDERGLVARTTGLHDALLDSGLVDLADGGAVRERIAVLEASVPRLVARWLTPDHDRAQLHIAARDVGIGAWRRLEPALLAAAHEALDRRGLDARFEVRLTGASTLAEKAMTGVLDDLAGSLAVDVTAILLFMTLLFRSVRLALLAMVPNLLPLVLVLGAMGALGIEIRASTVIVFSVALGIAVDDTIHFVHRYREEARAHGEGRVAMARTLTAVGQPVAWTTAILVAGFLINALSDLKAIVDFGVLSAITLVVALAVDLWLTPALLLTFRGRLGLGPAPAPSLAPAAEGLEPS